jgi:fructuronate reductase
MTAEGQPRLRASTLHRARTGVLPDYDRSAAPCITHLGFGAFARAHLAVYADALLRRGRPALVRGVSIRSQRAQDQLEPQDGLFTVAVREPGEDASLQVIGALASVETGPAAAFDAMTSPATKLVTLTITEKGYEPTLEPPSPSGIPVTVPALIAQALDRRRRDEVDPPVFAPLDNLLHNGDVLRARVLEAAAHIDPDLAAWIACDVRFPNSVVDRMVPAPTERDVEDISDSLGLLDLAAVSTERHRSWIMQSVEGLAPLSEVGVWLVDDVTPYERRKLWLLNGPHSAVAYGGLLMGHDTIAGAVVDRTIAHFVRGIVDDTLQVAEFPDALVPTAFADEALRRFANPALGHRCAQVGADGSSKLPQRLLPVVTARRERALPTTRFAAVAAIWIAATAGVAVPGVTLPNLQDPMAAALQAASRGDSLHALSHLALGAHADAAFTDEVASVLRRLTIEGPALLEAER